MSYLNACVFTEEMTTQRELAAASENSLAAFLSNVLPDSDKRQDEDEDGLKSNGNSLDLLNSNHSTNVSQCSCVIIPRDAVESIFI